ncbi:MAG TPA: helix-turn-helix transcriptional regulator [Acidimicrobiales bacterium]
MATAIDDVGTRAPPFAGTFCYEGGHLVTGWHHHEVHQLEYALAGLVEVEDVTGHYLLPPQQAAWIPAGVRHESVLHAEVRTISVFFDPTLVDAPVDRVRIIAVEPLLREMVIHAVRWPTDRLTTDPRATTYFVALGNLVAEALQHEAPLRLPTSEDPIVAAAMAFTRDHLQDVTVEQVARAVGTSARTLRRRFVADVGMPWRTYLLVARLLHSMTLLARPDANILSVALEVGFDSATGFGRAFRAHSGETPSVYRRRVLGTQTVSELRE